MNFFQKELEMLSRDALVNLQSERLKKTIHYAYAHNRPYREKMQAKGIAPEDIRSVDDLKHLPFTDKDDFRTHYPLGMCCVDRTAIREIHTSSGSTGIPVVNAYTDNDQVTLSKLPRHLGCLTAASAFFTARRYMACL
jgi:phenylacetate-CoA ligase